MKRLQAIESAKCRIYKLNYDLEGKLSPLHQKKAEDQKELMEITIEALEKQKAKKVVYKPQDAVYRRPYCPTCGNELFDDNYSVGYCECGQKLYTEEGGRSD